MASLLLMPSLRPSEVMLLVYYSGWTEQLQNEIGIRIGLIHQREMPPFLCQRLEAVGQHGFAQDHAVSILCLGDAGIIGMAQFSEIRL